MTGLIAEAMVQRAETDQDLVDFAVIAALRGCLSASRPDGPQARSLFDDFSAIASRDDVGTRAFHVAVKNLLKQVLEHRDKNQKNDPSSFLQYLTLLCS